MNAALEDNFTNDIAINSLEVFVDDRSKSGIYGPTILSMRIYGGSCTSPPSTVPMLQPTIATGIEVPDIADFTLTN
jgi:hypothetical protein